LTRNLQGIKIAFGTSFSPVVARFHADRRTAELNDIFQTLSRLSLVAILPIVLAVGALHADLLRLFDPAFGREAGFVFPLLAVPVLACAVGLAATLVVMSGLVGWNLFNSVLGAAANLLLCLWLIPRYELWGAAIATLVAVILVRTATVAESRLILGVRPDLPGLARPLAAAAVCAAGLWAVAPRCPGPLTRILSVVAAAAAYLVLAWRFGLTAEERASVAGRFRTVRRFLRPGAPA
jgi:O-antigen/teichoic acid export membrane protein